MVNALIAQLTNHKKVFIDKIRNQNQFVRQQSECLAESLDDIYHKLFGDKDFWKYIEESLEGLKNLQQILASNKGGAESDFSDLTKNISLAEMIEFLTGVISVHHRMRILAKNTYSPYNLILNLDSKVFDT